MALILWTISILLLLLASPRVALVFTLIAGFVLEALSPYPPFTYLLAILAAFIILRIFVRNVVSHRTLWGGLITAVVGTILLQTLLFVFAWFSSRIASGWVPILYLQYWPFLFWRTIITTILVSVAILIFQQLSPKIRGVLIEPRKYA